MLANEQFERFLAAARRDPAVVGLALGVSRGKGSHSEHSDYDLLLVARDDALEACRERYHALASAIVAPLILSLTEFTGYAEWGTAFEWARYGLARTGADRS